ncbi:MAG: family protein phosphatase [Frankiales bacterium]|nr:family protein phosphatase [Frankiales bacterium]
MSLTLRYAAASDVGLRRDGNEDSAYAGPRLLAVADGVGGAAAGEVASSVTISHLAELDEDAPGSDLLAALQNKAASANEELQVLVDDNNALEGMSTTLTALLWDGGRLGLAHIGDSRGYLYRDGELHRITTDHTLVQSLVDEGRISAEEATVHPQRSLIMRALDGRSEPELDLSLREARAGDRYLLCSDGLSDVVSEDTIRDTLALADPQEVVERLVELALRGGGPDNVTCVVADLIDGPLPDAAPLVVGAAAARGAGKRRRDADTAAGRAAIVTRPEPDEAEEPEEPEPIPARRKRRWRRSALISLLVLIVLGGAAGGTYAYVHAQYYVGVDHGQVVVFRGVSGSIAGWSLHSVDTSTGIAVTDLPTFEQEKVQDGITASSKAAAAEIVTRLRNEICTPTPTTKCPVVTP